MHRLWCRMLPRGVGRMESWYGQNEVLVEGEVIGMTWGTLGSR